MTLRMTPQEYFSNMQPAVNPETAYVQNVNSKYFIPQSSNINISENKDLVMMIAGVALLALILYLLLKKK